MLPSEHGISCGPLSQIRFISLSLVVSAIVFAGVAPTLRWLEFSSGSENLVVETVLEMRRSGPWLVPELQGVPRTHKPPLANWICAVFVKPASVHALSDRSQRDAAYRQLAWEVRWPALFFGCLTLLVTAGFGRLLFSETYGVTAAAMMGSTILFLRFGRTMTTDVQLALWVSVANLFFALAILRKRFWLGCIGGAAGLGLALMSKGPVALAQTVVPVVLFFAWRLWIKRPMRIAWVPIAAATIFTLMIALPWPIWVATRLPGQIRFWLSEISHAEDPDFRADPPWVYLALIPMLLPWAGFFFLGLVRLFREKSDAATLLIMLVIAPIVVMVFFKEKNERYLLPMAAPSALICAAGFLWRERDAVAARGVIAALTWGILLAIALGLPLMGATWLRRVDGATWWTLTRAIVVAVPLIAGVAGLWWLDATGRRTLLPAGVVAMLAIGILFMSGYAHSVRGRSDGRPVADAIVNTLPPTADVWFFSEAGRMNRVPNDVPIYLNRVVRAAVNPATLPTTPTKRAMLFHCRGQQTIPISLSAWPVIGETSKNKGIWRACVPPPQSD